MVIKPVKKQSMTNVIASNLNFSVNVCARDTEIVVGVQIHLSHWLLLP